MIKIFTLALLYFSVSGCAALISSKADWGFVQSVGGIKIGFPKYKTSSLGHNWFLPVYANVSGSEKITVEPSTANSGMECSYVSHTVVGENIFIQINTSVIGFVSNSAVCPELELGKFSEGVHTVYYGSKNEKANMLGVITIKL